MLHVTSLPGRYGIGDLGPKAYEFADLLARTDQSLWQVLPLGPVGHGASPYSSLSTFAGNPLLISPRPLLEAGLLTSDDVAPLEELPDDHVDYARLVPHKEAVLQTAYERFRNDSHGLEDPFHTFRDEQSDWLDDYALFMALKDAHGGAPWHQWEDNLVHRNPQALDHAHEEHREAVRMHAFWQFLFDRQWSSLQSYCHSRDIRLFGDIPIYVAHDSSDTWANQDLFFLDDDGQPTRVAGVPPDYFSPEGQRWGNPLYRWDRMRERGYRWWIRRVERVLSRVDIVRIDHFRGFEAYWEIPADEETAIHGDWTDGPGRDVFDAMRDALGDLPVVAEDLGVITDPVRNLRDDLGLPGMAILQFAFDGDPDHDYLPHNYRRTLVAYTGTHDNDTIAGWWNGEMSDEARDYARRYLDLDRAPEEDAAVHRQAVRALMASPADRVVTPVQDVLGLGTDARMNVPGEPADNWTWRATSAQLNDDAFDDLAEWTYLFGRSG